MKSQIELLTLQREQLSQSLSRVVGAKAPILLAAAPTNKRKRAADASAAEASAAAAGEARSNEVASSGVASLAASAHTNDTNTAKLVAGAGADDPGVGAVRGGDNGGYGCVRAVDWEVVLSGRRRKLVQAALPLDMLVKLQAENKKRFRARDGLSALRDSNFFLGKERPKTIKEIAAARAATVAQQQQHTPVSDVKGNVTNGGRKLVTASGQKVIIKFSAKNPGLSPRTPTPQIKNGRNGLTTPRGMNDTPQNSHKKQRGFDSPRTSHTPRDNQKQEWGKFKSWVALSCVGRAAANGRKSCRVPLEFPPPVRLKEILSTTNSQTSEIPQNTPSKTHAPKNTPHIKYLVSGARGELLCNSNQVV